jgi:multiple sugar transport system ATP-binding protein
MRMVAGLEDVTEGRIFIGDADVTELPPRKRSVSMIFQNYAVWPHMTVYENIAYALRLKKMDKPEIDEIVQEVSKMVKIDMLLKRLPAQLSGGQQQRVAVARAIAVRPKIFLMDEPLSNLDAKLRGSMRTELKAIHVETEATSVFVTHDQSEAMSMADRIVIMKDGEIIQIGTPDDVYHDSGSIFVADFIGTPPTNFLDSELARENGQLMLKNPHIELALDPEHIERLKGYDKREIVLGIRPENFELVDESDSIMSADCLVSEPQGSHQIVAIKLGEEILKITASAQPKIVAGDRVHLSFRQANMRFYDPKTELRV